MTDNRTPPGPPEKSSWDGFASDPDVIAIQQAALAARATVSAGPEKAGPKPECRRSPNKRHDWYVREATGEDRSDQCRWCGTIKPLPLDVARATVSAGPEPHDDAWICSCGEFDVWVVAARPVSAGDDREALAALLHRLHIGCLEVIDGQPPLPGDDDRSHQYDADRLIAAAACVSLSTGDDRLRETARRVVREGRAVDVPGGLMLALAALDDALTSPATTEDPTP